MTEQACTGCGVNKPLDGFWRDARERDGRRRRCIDCDKRVKRRWVIANPDHNKEYNRVRRKDPEYRQRRLGWERTHRTRNPDKTLAQRRLQRAVREGRLVRPLICEQCGGIGDIHAHHDDYSRALDVRWICRDCHTELHAAAPKEGT